MQVHQLVEQSAEKYPGKKAVWYQNKWVTFSEINLLSNKIANYLIKHNINKGDRVAILLENSINYVISYYGILKSGAVTVALNTENTKDSLVYLFKDSGCKAVISQRKYTKILAPAVEKAPDIKVVITDSQNLFPFENIGHCNQIDLNTLNEHEVSNHPGIRGVDLDLASLVYTSGSTGKPKAVVLSHLNIVANTRSIVEYLKLTSNDRIMVVLPFYYIYGKSLLNTHFSVGASVVIDNRFAFPNVILDTMKQTEVTGFSGVPTTFSILLNKSSIRKYHFDSLRYVTQAGGAMAPSIQKQVVSLIEPARLYIMYGATEASARLSYLDPDNLPDKWGSIGKAIPNVDLFVANDTGTRLPANQEGEIVAHGSNIMQGYWNDFKQTSEVLKNGLYYTGDIGKMDEDGFIFIVGRKKDMIKVGGERVSAKEIEEVLLELNEIVEVAIIGVDDEILGESIKAFIALQSDKALSRNQIVQYLRKKLPAYKIPKDFEFRKSLPKNESGKILKTKLKLG